MFFFKPLIVAAIYGMFAAVLSVAQQDIKKPFTFRRSTPRSSLKSRPAPVLPRYNRFKKSVPEHVSARAATSTGTIIVSPNDFDHDYLMPITIGGQTLNVLLDTGSQFLFYDPSKSTTSVPAGSKWQACYDGGRCCIGDLYTDTVSVGGVSIDKQAVGAATTVNNAAFLNEGFDGVLGLSFHGKSFGKLPNSTFLDNFEAELPAPLFTIDLKKGQPGTCDFGFIDGSKFTGDITYVPVDSSQGDWTFDIQGYTVGTGSSRAMSVSVIADTGTAFVFLPQSIVDAYYAAIPGSFFDPVETLYAFPCGSTPPSITFDIGTYKAVLPGSFIESVPTDDNPANCLGGIQTSHQPNTFILGSLFLKSQFVVFRGGSDPRIGFAPKRL